MGEDTGAGGTAMSAAGDPESAATGTRDPEQIEREIEQTREQLGDTVEALSQKTDVKAQARQKLQDTKVTMAHKRDQLLSKAKDSSPENASAAASQVSGKVRENPLPVAAVGAFAAGFLAGRLTGR